MSGIVGILNLDGAPADPQLLQALTCFLRPRGPDAQRAWSDGPIGFGHTLFKTTDESEHESQPFTLGTGTWITADARVDAQRQLIEQLNDRGQRPAPHVTDPELILRAYEVWGESCVDHLLGDFAFGIWDARQKKLFCARDQMGVKPFYYSQVGSFVVFSNALDCIRQCPAVSDRLNDLAIADFLLFEHNQDSATTSFAEIQRLPPAHCMSWSAAGIQIRRYWSMPIDEPIYYKRKDDYCDRFKELLSEAVGDRLRTDRVGIFMSGGLDSPTLAATACELGRKRYPDFDLRALTTLDGFNPDEANYAGMVAKHLGIPIQFDKWDDRPVDPHWERTPFSTPEPSVSGWYVLPNRANWQKAGAQSRVFFWGEGPDNVLLLEWRSYLSYLAQRRQYGRLFGAIGSTVFSQGRLPFWGRISRRLNQTARGPKDSEDAYPSWLDQAFEARLLLRARWNEVRDRFPSSPHPLRPHAFASLQLPLWQVLFEGEDAGVNESFFEMRHPFFDLRLLSYLLAIPPLPWCRSKYLIRRAMRGALPAPVLHRDKSAHSGGHALKHLALSGLLPFHPTPDLLCYINPKEIPDFPNNGQWKFGGHIRVRSLNHWLQYSRKGMHNPHVEGVPNGFVSENFAGKQEAI